MLGSQIGEETGQTMAVRVLPGDSATMETSFRSTGQLLGVATTGFRHLRSHFADRRNPQR